MSHKSETILVTGATGMVGSHLVQALVQKGYHVKATFRKNHPDLPFIHWVQADILDVVALEEVMEEVDIVYHCAAQVSFDSSNEQSIYQTNVEGTANVVNASLNASIKQFIYVSSVAAIGGYAQDMISENSIWNTDESYNTYAKSKHLAEMEVRRAELEGLKVYIVNPSIILGGGDWTDGSTALFKKIYDGFPYYTEGVHGFVDVLDVVEVLTSFLDKGRTLDGQRFILNGENVTYLHLFSLIAKGFSIPAPHKNVRPWVAAIVWRLSYLKAKLTGKPSLLTKNSAKIAQSNIQYDNAKILSQLPDFHFRPLEDSIKRICEELKEKYRLS